MDARPDQRLRRGGTRWCWHRWTTDVLGVWRYSECSKCGRREAARLYFNLAGPVDIGWVETGQWTPPPAYPAPGGLPCRPAHMV